MIYLIWQVGKLREFRKHDLHLFKFCQIRRDIISYARENYEDFSEEEYIAFRKLLDILNDLIHSYKYSKTVIFDFRLFLRYVKNNRLISEEFAQIPETNNEYFREVSLRLNNAVIDAFFAYTPFLRYEIILKISYQVLLVLSKMGITALQNLALNLREARVFIRESYAKYASISS